MREQKKCKETNENAITLIALIISIIVMLILAGVSINAIVGDNGIITQAIEAREQTIITSEKEKLAEIMVLVTADELQNPDETSSHYVGETLYDKNLTNGSIWNVIIINDTQEIYGTGWTYIEKGTELSDYGGTEYAWLINYETGETIVLEEDSYIELDYSSSVAVTDGLIFNIDPSNISDETLDSWGDAEVSGFDLTGDYDEETGEQISGFYGSGILLDGVDDEIMFYSEGDFLDGFTLSFYGKYLSDETPFLAKQNDGISYSCRFMYYSDYLYFSMTKNLANSSWSAGSDRGENDWLKYSFENSLIELQDIYFDIVFDAENYEFSIYINGQYCDSTTVDETYWDGGNVLTKGAKQVLEDSSYPFRIGSMIRGDSITGDTYWSFGKLDIYSMKFYSRPLNSDEISESYDVTIGYHSVLLENT